MVRLLNKKKFKTIHWALNIYNQYIYLLHTDRLDSLESSENTQRYLQICGDKEQ